MVRVRASDGWCVTWSWYELVNQVSEIQEPKTLLLARNYSEKPKRPPPDYKTIRYNTATEKKKKGYPGIKSTRYLI